MYSVHRAKGKTNFKDSRSSPASRDLNIVKFNVEKIYHGKNILGIVHTNPSYTHKNHDLLQSLLSDNYLPVEDYVIRI